MSTTDDSGFEPEQVVDGLAADDTRVASLHENRSRPCGHTAELDMPPAGGAWDTAERGGFTEFVPLPFVPMEAAMYVEPLNPPVKDAGLVAPPRLVRPGLVGAR